MRKQQGDCFTWQGVLALSCLLKRAAWYLRSKYHEQPPGCECCCLTYNPHSLSIPPHSVAASGFCFFDVSSRSFDLASDVSILSFLIWLKICFQYSVFKVQSEMFLHRISEISSSDPMGLSGLEPPTSRLSGVRSNRLSYKPLCKTRNIRYNIFYHSSSSFPIILSFFSAKSNWHLHTMSL